MKRSFWLAPLLLLPVMALADATVYRWTDATGQVHFSQTPPGAGKQYDMIQGKRAASTTPTGDDATPAGPSAEDVRAREKQFIEKAEADRRAKNEAREKEKVAREESVRKCTAARDRVSFLEERTARRLVTKADDGNYARVPEDEFLKRLDAAKKDVADNCGKS
ncbi:uncharacterized protein DUF4124 [Panacagrimonas perspica]|uniref:Uncharacterized protein DUF4124 n=1 Tax=Panacagrimonas perspica TaxID=381431 RepID=A0A4S3K5Q9_9GAMM|nr:DUF4124 domain-containing protein [Panacagrimonas perspica]TDU28056.1 uncharacterized protein DUF4124 [Panacagrimonas perspica]THD03473.1 hypothetical protein B1810_09475 [Panacagrimonas perspica]